jgi:hypothetical protein
LIALHERSVNPIDARAAPLGVHRPGAAKHHHRHAVDVGVEDRHTGVLQADHVVHDGDHRFVLGLGITVRHGHRNFLVMAEDHFRLVVAAVVDDRIVNAAKGRARIEGGVLDIKRLHQIDDDIGPILRLFLFHSGHCFPPPQVRGSALHTKKSAAWLGLIKLRFSTSLELPNQEGFPVW